jgi:hypothetical protein
LQRAVSQKHEESFVGSRHGLREGVIYDGSPGSGPDTGSHDAEAGVRYRLNVFGDGVIRHIQDKAADGRRRFDNLLSPDLAALADLAGIPFQRVCKADGFGAAVDAAIRVAGPALVEVDMAAIGEHPPYFPYVPKVK